LYLYLDGLWLSSTSNSLAGSSVVLLRDDASKLGEEDSSSESSEDTALREAEEEQQAIAAVRALKAHKLRVYTKNHKYSGKKFRVLIFFKSASRLIFQSPNSFFSHDFHYNDTIEMRSDKTKAKLLDLDILFLFQESRVNTISQFLVKGIEILKVLPQNFLIDFSTKFRRETFAMYLAKNIQMTFTVLEDYHFKLFGIEA
jgi:hypothetical protein